MNDGLLKERKGALEEEFFRRYNEKLLDQLRASKREERTRDALQTASGISDRKVLDELGGLGIESSTLAAFVLAPLVQIAWANGAVEDPERRAILADARVIGLEPGAPARAMFEDWLVHRPPETLLIAWVGYTRAVCAQLAAETRQKLKEDVSRRARAVAEAAGGFLGLGSKISTEERRLLERIEEAFRFDH